MVVVIIVDEGRRRKEGRSDDERRWEWYDPECVFRDKRWREIEGQIMKASEPDRKREEKDNNERVDRTGNPPARKGKEKQWDEARKNMNERKGKGKIQRRGGNR